MIRIHWSILSLSPKQSFTWSQCENGSFKTFDSFADNSNEEEIEAIKRRLKTLEIDCAVVSQLYRAHKQRAIETNKTVFRKAYKSNAQRVRTHIVVL